MGKIDWLQTTIIQTAAHCKPHLILGMYKGDTTFVDTVKPVCNDHLYNNLYYLWFIQ